ncbi:phophatase-like protein [Leishmania tarentolae]|uniref:Phophatase-like protein n=1 Tax=Leishmania tarentolae TaxID=5689 RepID=A0A640K8C2_LEITA|nr:phophatase-like protein [Leishmania tarentolae]
MPTRPQQRRRRHPQRRPSKQLMQIRDEGSGIYADSKTSSPLVHDTPYWPSRTSPSATAEIDGRTSGAGGTDSCDRGGGTGVSSVGDGEDCDNSDGRRTGANMTTARHSPQRPREHRYHLRMSPRVTSAHKSKNGDRRRASSSGSGLDRAAAAVVLSSTASLARTVQAPASSSCAGLGGHITYYGPPSLRSLSDSDGGEAGTQSSKNSSSSLSLAAAHATPGSAPWSPAVRMSNYGGDTAFESPDSANDGATQVIDRCKPESTLSPDGESGARACASPSPPRAVAATSTVPLTYAAVASSSLHGKRLPQSRVSFSQWRKRVYCGSASTPSTTDSANATSGTPSTTTASGTIRHASSEALLNPVPSAPLMHMSPLEATAASTPCSTGKRTSVSTPSIDGDGTDNAADDGDGKANIPSGDEHDCTSGTQPHPSASALMPPLPPSVHRHQPTHLILRLPHVSIPQQVRNGPDTDEDTAYKSSTRTVSASGIATAPNQLSPPVVPPPKGSCTATAAAAPCLSFSASEVTPTTSARTPGGPPGAQQQPTCALKPVTSSSYLALSPTTPMRGGGKDGARPKAAAAAGKGLLRISSAASFFKATEILPGLFLGAYADATDTEALAAHSISLVINCSHECPVTSRMVNNPHHVRYIQCPLRDHSDEAIAPFFTPVTRIIHEQLHRRQVNHQRMARRTSTTSASGVDGKDAEDVDVQGRMRWAWTDEAENVWVTPPLPVTPSMPVGGQPSFKESKRETPCTPSSAPGLGTRFGEGAGFSSAITSCSPSPIPGGSATFPSSTAAPMTTDLTGAMDIGAPGVATAAAASGSADMFSATHNSSTARTNTLFKTAPVPTLSTTLMAVTTSPSETSVMTALSASALLPSPITVVDPRDCGGVLVCCRMGVSRSATIIIAYLILYGCTLAPLDDTASLFVQFLERERRIIEEAGGLTFFTDHNGGVLNTSSPDMTTTTPGCPGRGSGCGDWSLASQGSAGMNGVQPFTQNPSAPSSPWALKRSAMLPVASPRSGGGGCVASSLATPLSANASTVSQQRLSTVSPATPIELASRGCQPCYLLHRRERRLQQQTQRRLLISGQQQFPDQQDEEKQMTALSASHTAARELGQVCGPMSSMEDHSKFGGGSSAMESDRSDGGHQEEEEEEEPQQQQQHCHRRVFCALSSSAPVSSHRGARGNCAMTRLETADADERIHGDDEVDDEETQQQQQNGGRRASVQKSESLVAAANATTTSTLTIEAPQVQSTLLTRTVCVADERRGDGENMYKAPSLPGEQQQQQGPSCSSCTSLSPQLPMKGRPHSDLNTSANTLLGVSFTSSGGGSGSALGGAVPAMTYRDAFDAVKRQKADVNPNIGFVLALRELAGGGDFNLSTSL